MKKILVWLILSIFMLGLAPAPISSAATYSYEWNDSTKTATVYYNSNPVLDIKQISVSGGLTTFEEVLEITSHVDYTLTSNDLKWLWKKHRGEHGIRLSELQKLTTKIYYVVTIPDYGDVEHSQAVPNIISYTNVTDEWNVNPWELDLGVLDSKEKWDITYYSAASETNISGTIGLDRYEVITHNPLKIRFYWNVYEQIGSHEETKYRDVFKSFSPVGKTIHNGQIYTIKMILHKKAEVGDFSIHLTPEIAGVKINELTWWNSSWDYKIASVLTDVPSGGYQYDLTVHSASGTNNQTDVFLDGHNATNFADIRFVLGETTELGYWIVNDTIDPIEVWVNVTGNGTVRLYYGNPTAGSESDSSETFDEYSTAYTDFSSTQGEKDWYYQEWTGAVYQNMTWGSTYWDGAQNPCGLYTTHDHPGSTYYSARKWMINTRTPIFIEGNAHKGDTGGGDGVTAKILKNSTELWSQAIAFDDDVGYDFDLETIVNASEPVYFILVPGANGDNDGTYFNPTIKSRKYVSPEPSWGTWSDEEYPQIDADSPLQYNTQRKLTRTLEGYLHRVYTKFDGNNYRVYYAKSMDNGVNWAETVLTDTGVNNTHPSIAGDSEDSLWVVYSREEGGIRYRKYEGVSWQSEQTISSDSGETPVIAVDSEDNVYVVWAVTPLNFSSPTYIYHTYYNGTWSDIATLIGFADSHKLSNPAIAVDSDNYMHFVCRNYRNDALSFILHQKHLKGTLIGSTTYLVCYDPIINDNPSIAIDLNDYIHVVWETGDHKIKYKKYTTSWQCTEEVCDGGLYGQYAPSVSVYGTNHVYVTWFGLTAGYPSNYIIREKHWSGSWSGISDILHPTGKNATYPNSISALYPKICGDCYLNIPLTGFSFVYDEDDGTVKYYNASTWRCEEDYTLTIKARNTETNQYITTFTVDFSSGETQNTDSGVIKYSCLESGYYEATVSSNEYHSAQQSIVLDQSKEVIVYLTPITETVYVLPREHLVEFRVVDVWGIPLSDVTVNATGYETTVVNLTWWEKVFGYDTEMEVYNTTMEGTTDRAGHIGFVMLETIKYKMWFTNASQNISAYREIYPKDDRYTITIGEIPEQKIAYWVTTEQNNTANTANITLHYSDYNSPVKTNWVNFSVYYLDNDTLAYTHNFTTINETNENTSINLNASYSYKVKCVADHDDFGTFTWFVTVVFIVPEKPKLPVVQTMKDALSDWQIQTFSLFVIILFSLIFGGYSQGVGGMVCVFLAVGFHVFGMMPLISPLAGAVVYPLIAVMSILNLMSERREEPA